MIKIAVPNKGGLFGPTLELLSECGYHIKKSEKALTCIDHKNNVEFYFIRASDIPMYLSAGIIDIGITGIDFCVERQSKAVKVLDLNFGHSKLCVAVPNESEITSQDEIQNLRIATSFVNTTQAFFAGKNNTTVELEGAVEISVKLGISDAIVDIVETGSSIKQAGLRIIGEPMSYSNAAIFTRPEYKENDEIKKLTSRVAGKIVASQFVMIEYDAPKAVSEKACQLTPGIKSPTITPLKDTSWVAVKSMIEQDKVNEVMDQLESLGCEGIYTTKILSARI
ncbi:ATP phosphoribosyltransferase [Marinicellulosiphila megalodicopiae]|uniref:ATP phosphoribosyltransferase n=1 Tax=Marinicellulosiphila megalodicopiae TaxID=2724896 RepID=UPI003BB14976